MMTSAIRSLKKDFSRAFFYWLTFLITAIFIFSFFNLAYCKDMGFTIGAQDDSMVTFIAVLVSVVCMCVVFFANDFYVKNKSKEIAVDLICGGRYTQLVQFLLIQTGIIFITAIPIGIAIGYLLVPVLNIILHQFLMQTSLSITINNQAAIITVCLLMFEVFWCTLLNLGYSHRSTIRSLIQGEEKIKLQGGFFKINIHIPVWFNIILFFFPLVGMFTCGDSPAGMMVFAFIGVIGIYGTINKIIVPYIEKKKREKYTRNANELIYKGLIKQDLVKINYIIILLIFSAITFVTILGGVIDDPTQSVLAIISYVVSVILLSMSVMFKFSSEMDQRVKIFGTLRNIGFLDKDIIYIKRNEIIGLYGFIIGVCMLYILTCLLTMLYYGFIQVSLIYLLLVMFLLPMIICAFINYRYYKKH